MSRNAHSHAPTRTSPVTKLALMAGGLVALALVLLLSEGVLSLAGYGPPRRLFLKRTVGNEQIYQLNRDISELFFPKWATKPPSYQWFPAQKAAGTYRILATGESSTLGDPFGPQTAFPALLGEMLHDVAPGRQYEVVNCAVIAISSLDVLLIHKEALGYDPDAILIYAGHNEAYGADGIDTPVQRSFSSRGAAKFWLWLRNVRLVRLAREALGRLSPPKNAGATEGFGMWTMRDRLVPACGEKHARLLTFYRENLLEMLATARAKGVDVILCTLISNERDQSPMGSDHGCDFDPARAAAWQAAFAHGQAGMASADWPAAVAALTECRDLDPQYAEVRFRLGRCYDALGDSAAAIAEYRAARDYDAVHFRACSAQNEVVREVARTWDPQGRHRLVLVDLEQRLAEDFPRGAGRSFFTEHVHPYPVGHAWIAQAIARELAASPLASDLGAWDLARLAPPETYVARVGMSELDVAAGLYLTDLYKLAKWPFPNCYDNDQARAYVQARIRDIATRLDPSEMKLFQTIPTDRTGDMFDFGKRHYYLFTEYRNQRRGPEALREITLAQRYWWPAAFLEVDLAQVLIGVHRFDEAEAHIQRARALDPDFAPIHFVAGALCHGRGQIDDARREFQAYLQAEPQGNYASASAAALQMLSRPQR
jgi:tetratricopeptide (TPR) repeat protein